MNIEKQPIALLIETMLQNFVSEDLKYHRVRSVGVDKNIFRPGSSKFFKLFSTGD